MRGFARCHHSVPFCILSLVVTLSAQQSAPAHPAVPVEPIP